MQHTSQLAQMLQSAYVAYHTQRCDEIIDKFAAAARIQAAYRAYAIRNNYKKLVKAGNTIAACYRRSVVVYRAYRIFEAVQYQKRLKFYSFQATKIQAFYRGNCVRAHILDVRKRAQQIAYYTAQAAYQVEACRAYSKQLDELEAEKHLEDINCLRKELGKLHYLTSTKAIPGVFKTQYPKIQATLGGKSIDQILKEEGTVRCVTKRPVKILENLGYKAYK